MKLALFHSGLRDIEFTIGKSLNFGGLGKLLGLVHLRQTFDFIHYVRLARSDVMIIVGNCLGR